MNRQLMVSLLESQAIQIAVVITLVGAISMLLRRWPHVVYALWLIALAKCLTPPLWSSPTGLFSWTQPRTSTQIISEQVSPPNDPMIGTADAQIIPIAQSSISSPAIHAQRRSDWPKIVLILWLTGSGVVVAVTIIASLRLLRRLRHAAVPYPPELDEAIHNICKAIGRKKPVRLIVADCDFGPAVVGILRPTVVLPMRLLASSPHALRVALGHELAHLRRGDALLAAAQRLAVAIWWFHPLVWFMSARLTATREQCWMKKRSAA